MRWLQRRRAARGRLANRMRDLEVARNQLRAVRDDDAGLYWAKSGGPVAYLDAIRSAEIDLNVAVGMVLAAWDEVHG